MYFIACKTSPISRNNARYDNAIKASLMMAPRSGETQRRARPSSAAAAAAAFNAVAVFYGRHALEWQAAGGRPPP